MSGISTSTYNALLLSVYVYSSHSRLKSLSRKKKKVYTLLCTFLDFLANPICVLLAAKEIFL